MKKDKQNNRFFSSTSSSIQRFRGYWFKKGYDLVNITPLCEFKLGCSGWCNNFNEPEDEIYHVQIYYRNELIGNLSGNCIYPIDDEKYVIFQNRDEMTGNDFIIFRKVKK